MALGAHLVGTRFSPKTQYSPHRITFNEPGRKDEILDLKTMANML